MSTQAIADEEGSITLVNTYMRKTESESHMYTWASHRNAIFDIALAGLLHPPNLECSYCLSWGCTKCNMLRARLFTAPWETCQSENTWPFTTSVYVTDIVEILPQSSPMSERFHADGDDLLATASGDQSIRVWDLSRAVRCIHAQKVVCNICN